MAGVTGAHDPGGCVPAGRAASEMAVDAARRPERVRELQRRLWVAAKRSPGRRFHSLYDKLWRGDVLLGAWERVCRNKGASGVDGVTLAAVEAYGVERMLVELSVDLREGRYRPAPVRRVEIPKPQGGVRPLGIPVVRDRVCQQAARLVLEPIFEADFLPVSYGFRPRRSAVQAKEQARVSFVDGYVFAVDGDIRDYFSTIEHERLLALVAERVSDGRMLKLLGKWLEAGVMEDGLFSETVTGTPQGGVISPLLANIYLHPFDKAMVEASAGRLVRYADDWLVLCRSRREAEAALALAGETLAGLGLELHPDKTRVVDLREGREGFDFLGCHFRARLSGRMLERGVRRYYLRRWPSQRAMKRARAKIKAKTGRGRAGADIREVIADINPILRGWGNYFRNGNAATKFIAIDRYAERRLRGLMRKRYGRHLRPGQSVGWTREWFEAQGLYRLRGTIRYPAPAS